MKKITLVLFLCLAVISLSSSKAVSTEYSQIEPYGQAYVVTDIPGQPAGYEAYFASKETANIFINFFGGGTLQRGIVCVECDQIISQVGEPCNPC